ncbi:hypothetical protein V8E36_004794, partial [Tilletia maclaganii]
MAASETTLHGPHSSCASVLAVRHFWRCNPFRRAEGARPAFLSRNTPGTAALSKPLMAPCRKHTLKGGCYGWKGAPKSIKEGPFSPIQIPPFQHLLTFSHLFTQSRLSLTYTPTLIPTLPHTHTPISHRAFHLLDLIHNQVDIIYDYDASILILKHVDLIVHHAPPPWSSSSLTAVWVHHQEVGSYYEQGPDLSKGLTPDSTSTSHQHGPCPPPRLQCRGRDKVCLADAISAFRYFAAMLRIFAAMMDDAALRLCGTEVPRHGIHPD